MSSVRRSLLGAGCALVAIAALTALMAVWRDHLSIATAALVLVIPVVLAVALGGFAAGVVAVVAGFLAYDLFFIPPYGTLAVGGSQNWVALVVYVVVMLVVSRVVQFLQAARADARRREEDTRRLYDLSNVLIADTPLPELLQLVATTVYRGFHPRWVAVLLPSADGLAVAATAGEPLSPDEVRSLRPAPGSLQSLTTSASTAGIVQAALTATGRPVGVLAMPASVLDVHDAALLRTYANQAALAIERSQLRTQALRAELLEEVDRWRGAMMGAVSHDLRTPLAAIKASVSTLRRPDLAIPAADRAELLEVIETQADGLDRLVADLLDMTRIEAGSLELRLEVGTVADLVDEAVASLGAVLEPVDLNVSLAPDLPPVEMDQVLMTRVVANLLENAARHSPPGAAVEVRADTHEGVVEVTVSDHGPGIPEAERERVFQMFNRVSGGGRAGLGLTIAKAFVEAHGQTITVGERPGGGARLRFTLAPVAVPADVA